MRLLFPVGVAVLEEDDELLYRLRPGVESVRRVHTAGGRWVRLAVNEAGYRGDELRERGVATRVAVFGDSLVLAEDTPRERTFCARLEAELDRRTGRAHEVVNAGVTGYGPDQACLRLEREIDALAPEVVVLVLCATNDLGDLVRNGLFGLDEDGGLVRRTPRLGSDVRDWFARRRTESGRPALLRLIEASRSPGDAVFDEGAVPFVDWYLRAAAAEHAAWRAGSPDVVSILSDHYDVDVALAPGSPAAVDKIRLLGGVLERFRGTVARRGARLLAVVVPSGVDLDPGSAIRVDPARWPTYLPSQLAETLREASEAAGIETFDLSSVFVSAGPETLFVGGLDFHWNDRGQALAAVRTAARIAP